jgi:hypothetical protein
MLLAYLDPGSGSLLLQAVLGGAAGLIVVFKTFGRRIFKREPVEQEQTAETDTAPAN